MEEDFMRRFAFTLAEVLITLMIIGIVAALTIPSVISNYQQQEFKTGLKKAVSVLNEAIQTNIAQDGETPYENGNLYTYLQRHMNVIKTRRLERCYNKTTGNVVPAVPKGGDSYDCDAEGYLQNNTFYTLDGMRFEVPYLPNLTSHLYLHESGTSLVSGKRYDSNYTCSCSPWGCDAGRRCGNSEYEPGRINFHCGSYGLSENKNNTLNPPCVIMVDVNGDKKPNPQSSYSEKFITFDNGSILSYPVNQTFDYSFPSVTDKKLSDIFTIMITDEKAIPFGVVAQRAMYSK